MSASISTPVGPMVAASARMRSPPAARSGVTVTTRSVSAIGWQSGMSSRRSLAAHDAGQLGEPRTSPFGPPPSMIRLSVSSDTATNASATARRAVGGFADTSTIRGRPVRSTWVRRRRSERGGIPWPWSFQYRGLRIGWDRRFACHASPGRGTRRPASRGVSRVEPPKVDRDRRPRVLGRLPARPRARRPRQGRTGRGSPAPPATAGQADADAAGCVARRRPGPSRSATTRRNARRPGLFDTSSRRTVVDRPGAKSRAAGKRPDRRADEELEGDEARHGVARQAEQERSSAVRPVDQCRRRTACRAGPRRARARSGRPPRTRSGQVIWADGHAARDDDRVGTAVQGRAQPRPDIIESSGAMPRSMASAPAASTSALRPGPFASGIPAGPRSRPGARTSLPVASTPTRGRRWTRARRVTGAGREGDGGRGQRGAGGEDHRSLGQVITGGRIARPRRHRNVDQHPGRKWADRVPAPRTDGRAAGIGRRRLLDRDDRVGPARDRRPGRDAESRSPRPTGPAGAPPARTSPMTANRTGPILRRLGHVACADRVAVHRRVVPRRQCGQADHVLGHDPAACLGQVRDLMGRRARNRVEDGRSRLFDRQQAIAGRVARLADRVAGLAG